MGARSTKRGAGEIVLNMMNQDGVRNGYDIEQLNMVREVCNVPLIASGGAGAMEHFAEAYEKQMWMARLPHRYSTSKSSILVN